MDLFLDSTIQGAKASGLFEQLREAIVSGRLAAGDRLRVTDLEGGQVVDMVVFNAENPRE